LSPYAVSKLAGEYYCRIFHGLYGLGTVSLRYFNVFGPRQDPTSQYAAVIPNFVTAMLAGRPPQVHGDGLQSRDFTYITNAVDAKLLAFDAPARALHQSYNVASRTKPTLLDVCGILQNIVGTSLLPIHGPPRAGDVKHSLADIGQARRHLGYEPPIDLESGLRSTVAWYRA